MPAECGWLFVAASLAQVLAACLATWTIVQARKMMQQADDERRFSVEPDWEVASCDSYTRTEESSHSMVVADLVNTGLGPARYTSAKFVPYNNHQPVPGSVRVCGTRRNVTLPKESARAEVSWYRDKPLNGALIVSCTTRLGGKQSTRFHLRTSRGPGRSDSGEMCRVPSVTKLPRRWPWQRKAS